MLLGEDDLVDFGFYVLVALSCFDETFTVGCEHFVRCFIDVGATEDSKHLDD